MKAAQLTRYGGTEAISVRDVPVPVPTKGKVLIEVEAAGVNPFDWKLREGFMQKMIPLTFPTIIGGDIAGVIKELGTGVSGFTLGDRVYGDAMILSDGSGAFAELTSASTRTIAHAPENITSTEAAALPLAGTAALQALTEHIKLSPGEKILIHGGAGGIGSFAIQIAKHMGAYVATTARKKDSSYVKELGADAVIDYQHEKFEDSIKEFNAVFDTVGKDTHVRSYTVLKKGGKLVSMVEGPHQDLVQAYGVTALLQQTKVNTRRLVQLAKLVTEKALRIHIDKMFPLEQTGEALSYLKERSPRGKVVINIK